MRPLYQNSLAALCAIAFAQVGVAQRIAIRNVTVVDVGAGRHLRNQTVVIDGDCISAVVPDRSVNVSGFARTVDASGKYLIPGMWDMHIHLIFVGRPSLALLVASGIRVVGHPPFRGPSLADASDSGMASIEHPLVSYQQGAWASALDVMTPEARASLAEKWARNRTAFDPTIIAGVGFRNMPDSLVLAIIGDTTGTRDGRTRYVSKPLAREWRSQMEMKKVEGPQPDWATLNRQAAANLRMLDSAGVIILTGSDLGGPLVYPGSRSTTS